MQAWLSPFRESLLSLEKMEKKQKKGQGEKRKQREPLTSAAEAKKVNHWGESKRTSATKQLLNAICLFSTKNSQCSFHLDQGVGNKVLSLG